MKIDWKTTSLALLLSIIVTSIFFIFVLIPEVNLRINVNLNLYTNEDVITHFWSLLWWIIILGSTLAFVISFAFFYTIIWFEKKLRTSMNNGMGKKHKILLKSLIISAILSVIFYLFLVSNTYQTYDEVENYKIWDLPGGIMKIIDVDLVPQFMVIAVSFAVFVCLISVFYIGGVYLIKRKQPRKD